MTQQLCYLIEPPTLITWISERLREKNLLLVDLEFDNENDFRRLDLQLIFNPIVIARSRLHKRTYYLGTSGAIIMLNLEKGIIAKYTEGESFEVNYNIEKEHVRNSKLKLIGKDLRLTNVITPTLSLNQKITRKFATSFSGNENELASVATKKSIKWIFNSKRGDKVVRDYLAGTLYLCSYVRLDENIKHKGNIKIMPTTIDLFDYENKKTSDRVKILMFALLKLKDKDLYNKDGLSIAFEEE